jgi:hypothetical protein
MLGYSFFDGDQQYSLRTLKDNVSLLTPTVLDRINYVVEYGYRLLGKSESDCFHPTPCDSFVVETNIHYFHSEL